MESKEKNAEHPVFDAQNHKRLHPFDFRALSFERHGYWAKETVGFTKKLAFARAAALGLDPAAEICRWYGIISCSLQRANAKILRGEPVPARRSAPPPRLFRSAVTSRLWARERLVVRLAQSRLVIY